MNEVMSKSLAVRSNEKINFDIYKEVVQRLGATLTETLSKNDSDIFVKYVGGRVKSEDSLKKKMASDGLEYTKENLEKNIFDVAGLRVVCLYKDDIEKIVDKIENSGIKIIKKKDYLRYPKSSGYSGFHLIVEVPIQGKRINAEIQIRTLGMDLWSSLEHMVVYKQISNLEKFLSEDFEFFLHHENGLENNSLYNSYEYLNNPIKLFDYLAVAINTADEKLSELNKKHRNRSNVENNLLNLDMSMYNEAMNILSDIMNKEISFVKDGRKLVEHKVGRVKEEKNVFSKLARNNIGSINDVDIYVEMAEMSDIVGYRLVCPFLCDIDLVVDKLKSYANNHPNVIEIPDDKIQDFVTNPKENGYSSYHVNARVNVNAKDSTKEAKWVKTEIQVRTLAMDLWASYQRKLGFHKDISEYKDILSSLAVLFRNIDETFEPFGRIIRGISNNSLIEIGDNLPYVSNKVKVKKK